MTKTAFLFPGQGSQSVGMLADMAAKSPLIEQTFTEASDALGQNLWNLSQQGPVEELNKTENTQPALLAAGVACWRLWLQNGGAKPDFMAGHSLGEYTALVCAGALDFSAAIKLVARRGQLMQEAVPVGCGAMAAVLGLSDEQVIAACEQASADGVVSAANFNAPGQVVIAGEKNAVEKAVEICKDLGARRATLLAVSAPSHCALMQPAAESLLADLEAVTWRIPETPIVHNVDVMCHQQPASIIKALQAQLFQPVRWTDCVLWLQSESVSQYAECGPGKVLSALLKRIGNGRQAQMLQLEKPSA